MSPELYEYSWIVPTAPFAAFLIIVALLRSSVARYGAYISIAGIATSACVSALMLIMRLQNPHAPPYVDTIDWIKAGEFVAQIGVVVDNLSAIMMFVVCFIATAIQIYAIGYMEHEDDAGFARFFAYMSLFATSMLAIVVAPNFAQLFIGWELVGVSSYLLIGFWYYKKSAADAAKKAFIVNRFGDLGFLAGIVLCYYTTGKLDVVGTMAGDFRDSALHMLASGTEVSGVMVTVIGLLIFCGAVGKSAQFPLHIWLPDAMEGPTPVSALVHSATMVAAGVYLVCRCYPLFQATPKILTTVAWIGAITAFLAATMGLAANDIKRVLAYSTCSQLGYMMMALGMGGAVGGLTAGMFHLTTHAFFKALMFLGSGSVIHRMNTNDIWLMGGLGRTMKYTGWTFFIGCLAIAGIPPLAGFWSKDMIFEAVLHGTPLTMGMSIQFLSNLMLKILVVLVAFMTATYMFRLYFLTFTGTYRGERPEHPLHGLLPADAAPPAAVHTDDHAHHDGHDHAHDDHAQGHHGAVPDSPPPDNAPVMTIPLIVLSIFAVGVGWVNIPGLTHIFSDMISFGTHHVEHHFNALVAGLSIAAALGGIGVAKALWGGSNPIESERMLRTQFPKLYNLWGNGWYMDKFWREMVDLFMFGVARVMSWIDENIIDGLVNGVGNFTWRVGQMLREEQSGLVQQYATIMVIGVIIFLIGIGLREPDFVLSLKSLMKLGE